MVAIFTGLGAGFERGSAAQLGASGLLGGANLGRGVDGVFLNAATGNLVVSRQDEFLAGLGPDAALARTYNSQGRLGAPSEYWRHSNDRQIFGHSAGSKNVANATVKRLSADGSEILYTWEQGDPLSTPNGYYKTTDGAGAHDRLSWDGTHWTWVDGATGLSEKYEVAAGGVTWRISQLYDLDTNTLSFSYDGAGKLSRLTTDDGAYLEYSWDANGRLSSVLTGYDDLATLSVEALTPTRTHYEYYDASARLKKVTIDFSPHDYVVSDANTYWVEYTYETGSDRIASISQKDGSLLEIGYETSGARRVLWYQQTVAGSDKRRTDIVYDIEPGRTDVKVYTEAYVSASTAALTTSFYYDAKNQLTRIVNPPATASGAAQTVDYVYDADGNLLSATERLSAAIWRKSEYDYDARGNATTVTTKTSVNGTTWATDKVVTRAYDANNSLTRESFQGATASQASTTLYTRYVYDGAGKNHLRYSIGAEGRVIEYRYTSDGLLESRIEYTDDDHRYAIGSTIPTEANMNAWRDGRTDRSSIEATSYLYDARGNLKETKSFGAANSSGVAQTSEGYTRTLFIYDQSGQLLSRQIEGQTAETFVYDSLGRVVLSTDLSGGTTSIVFNDAATQTIVRTAAAYNATSGAWETTAASYIATSTYNKTGDLVGFTDSGSGDNLTNKIYSYVYDRLGRLRQRIANEGHNSITNWAPVNTYYLYDNLGRKTAEVGHLGEVVEYRYDAAGRMIATASYTVRLGATLLGQLAGVDNTLTIADIRPAGHAYDLWIWTVYDTAGRVVETIAGDGAVRTYAYDAAERLVATTSYFNKLTTTQIDALVGASSTVVQLPTAHANDVVERSFYDGEGNLIGSLDAEGYLTQIIYDAGGRKVRERAFANATVSNLRATGVFSDLLASITHDANRDRSQRYIYDGQGLLRFSVDALNYVTEYVYWQGSSSEGLAQTVRKTIVHAAAISGATYTYAGVKSAVSSAHASDRTSHAVLNNRGQLRYTIDATGAVVRFDYDGLGRVVKQTAYGERFTGAMNAEAAGWEGQLDTWSNTSANQVGARAQRTYYNNRNEAIFVIDPEGFALGRVYDGAGRIFSEVRYSAAVATSDATTVSQVAAADKGTAAVVSYRYDAFGRIHYVLDANGNFSLTEYLANGSRWVECRGSWNDHTRTYFVYDRAGHLVSKQRHTSEATNATLLGVSAVVLAGAERVASANGEYTAVVTRLGELQIFRRGELIWSNGVKDETPGAAYELRAETNGALKAYRIVNGVATQLWTSGTSYDGPTFIKMEDDGDLVLYKGTPSGNLGELWRSNSANMATPTSSSFAIVETYAYDGLGNVISTTGPGASTFTHDKLGRVKTATNALGVVTTYEYDAFGRGVKAVEAQGVINRTTYNYYDQLGRLRLSVDAEGYVIETHYNAFGEIDWVTRYLQKAANLASVSASVPPTLALGDAGAKTEFKYDKLGRLIETKDATGAIELHEYNAFGQRTATRNKIEGWTEFSYNARGLISQEKIFFTARDAVTPAFTINSFSYDGRGNLTQKVEAGLRTTTYAYDLADRLTSKSIGGVLTASSSTGAAANATLIEKYFYDSRGNVVEVEAADGGRTLHWYDKLDRRTHTLSASGVLTRTYYDGFGNVSETRVYADPMALPSKAIWGAPPKAGGASTSYRVVQYEYDALGRLTKTKAPAGRTATYNGSLSVSAASVIAETLYEYDALGNVLLVTDPRLSKTWSYYDKLGRKIAQIDAANYRTDWNYDSNGNVLSEKRYANAGTLVGASAPLTAGVLPTNLPTSDASKDRVTNFTYDLMGRRLTETRLGVLTHNGAGGVTSTDATVSYSYNGLGLVATKTEATGDIISYTYDVAGRMKFEQRYRHQGAGAYYGYTDYSGANVSPLVEYAYNGLNNLVWAKAVGAGADANRITNYTYDAAGRLASVTDAAGFKRAYIYDGAGRVRREEYNRADFTGAAAATEAIGYDYDAEGRITRQGILLKVSGAWSREGATIDTAAFSYNAFGDVIRRGFAHYAAGVETLLEAEHFEYDEAGRLIKANSGDGAWNYFMYDAAGNQTLTIGAQSLDFAAAAYDTRDEVLALWAGGAATIANTNVNGLVATITGYDARNQATVVREPKRQRNDTTWDDLSTTRSYNAFGEIAQEINAAGAQFDYSYNTMGRLIRTENPYVEARGENGNWITGYHATTFAPLATSGSAITFRPVEHRYYDVSGRLVAQRDANGNLTRYTLLAGTGYSGQEASMTEVISADGGVVRTKYDVHGDARRIEDQLYLAGAPTQHVTIQAFDTMGRLISMNRSGVLTDYYDYDGLGRRIKHANSFFNSQTVGNAYYNASFNAANAATWNYAETTAYDHQGRVTSVTTMGGDVTTHAYAWNGALVTTGMSAAPFGGWTETTTFMNGRTMVQKTDVFGHEVQKTDLGGHTTNLTYDKAGRLVQRSATFVYNGNAYPSGASLIQSYFNTGRLASVYQNGGTRVVVRAGVFGNGMDTFTWRGSSFAYDLAGNVVAQKLTEQGYFEGEGYYDGEGYWVTPDPVEFSRVLSDQTASYDLLGRIVSWAEAGPVNSGPQTRRGSPLPAASHVFAYDANGNVRRSLATFRAIDAAGSYATNTTTQDYWYRYDAMNRMVTSKGAFSGAIGSGSIVRSTTGVDTTYYLDGSRAFTINSLAGNRREDYTYDLVGRVTQVRSGTNVSAAGGIVGAFTYDAMGRVLTQHDYDGSRVMYSRQVTYNAKNQVLTEDVSADRNDDIYRTLSTYSYGTGANYALGAVTEVIAQNWKDNTAWPTTKTTTDYLWYDSALTWSVLHDPDNNTSTNNNTHTGYSYNEIGGSALLSYVDIADGRPRKVVFTSDMLGQVLRRDETDGLAGGDPHEVWLRFSGRQMGYVGNNGSIDVDYAGSINQRAGGGTGSSFADFDLAHDQINAYEQGSRGGMYTVQSGDTLQSIASNLWGDSSLWWKIAEINGLTAESILIEGQPLILPVGVQSNQNNATTFRPYDPLEVLGDLSPTAPTPKRGRQCGVLGQFMLVVVAIAVAKIVGPWVAKFASQFIPGAIAKTAAVIAVEGGIGISTSAGTWVAAGIGSAAGAVAAEVVTQGVQVAMDVQEKFSWNAVAMAGLGGAVGVGVDRFAPGWMNQVARSMTADAVTQAIGKVTGLQEKFSWAAVAGAGVGAYVGGKVAGSNPGTVRAAAAIAASTMANAAARSLIEGSDFGDNMLAALPSALAQMLFLRGASSTDVEEVGSEDDWRAEWERRFDREEAQGSGVGEGESEVPSSLSREEAQARYEERRAELEAYERQVIEMFPSDEEQQARMRRAYEEMDIPELGPTPPRYKDGYREGFWMTINSALMMDPFYPEAYEYAYPPTTEAQARGRADGQVAGQILTLGLGARSPGRSTRAERSTVTTRLRPRVNVAAEFRELEVQNGRLYRYRNPDGGHGLEMYVGSDGILGMDLRATRGEGFASGRDMVLSGLQRLQADGVQVRGIRGLWLAGGDSRNYAQYTSNVATMTPRQAAARTWTGTLAGELGYTQVSEPVVTSRRVTVIFTRPR